MTTLSQHRSILAAIVSVMMLSACSDRGSQLPASFGMSPSMPTQRAAVSHLGQRSWISPNLRTQSLLYVSDAENGVVDVYKNFRSNSVALAGQLTDLKYPSGDCVDSAGNVWVTEQYGQDVIKYAHGGTLRIATLSVPGFPTGCSVDPTTGNLAVVSWEEAQGYNSAGGVFIFAHAAGTPTFYTDQNLFQYFPPGYDPKGNLFVQGYNPTVELVELPHGGSSFQEISLGNTSIWAPGGVMWDGQYMAATDLQYQGGSTTAIYRISVSGTTGTVVGTTVLNDSCSSNNAEVIQPWIAGSMLIGGNHWCKYRVGFWNYPDGGNPTRLLPARIAPFGSNGQTISR